MKHYILVFKVNVVAELLETISGPLQSTQTRNIFWAIVKPGEYLFLKLVFLPTQFSI